MAGNDVRPVRLAGVAAVLAALTGCAGTDEGRFDRLSSRLTGERSEAELRAAVGWTDASAQAAIRGALPPEELVAFAARARAARRPPVPFPRRTVLVISGGGAYGAHPAGVLCGWTEAGTRPEFDVVTGVSTGALIAVFAFLGPQGDAELRRAYTTITTDDVYRRRRFPRQLLSEALADNTPLADQIARLATADRIRLVAAEHRKGRRLYVGTTDLDVRRGIFWDMGAIACRDTPADHDLFRRVLLASSAIPGFFPPVEIPVTVDGVRHVERHVDGGTASSMFFVPPYVPPDRLDDLPPNWLHGSDLYILVAGKMYPDPTPVKSRSLAIAGSAVSTILYDQTRSDLHKLFLLSAATGMNYHVSVIPKDLAAPLVSTEFDPEEMTRLFEAGAGWARGNPKWRDSPPGAEPGEGGRYRAGTVLTDTGRRSPVQPGAPFGSTGPIPSVVPEK